MDEASLLETTAEVSVAFTGFIGVFLVLAARDGRFPPSEAFAIRLIVSCSILPVFAAAFPLILHHLGLSGVALWRTASIALALTGLGMVVLLIARVRSLPDGEGRSLNYGFVLGLVATVACLLNVLGWPWPPGGGLYLLTVWSVVGIAGGNFVELLFRKLL